MATLYGRGKGKAGSHKPKMKKPTWLKSSKEEIEKLVIKLSKQELQPAQIGLKLRDEYGIPSIKIITKKIRKILIDNGIKTEPEELTNLVNRAIKLKKHIEKNKKDMVSKRGLQLTESKINRISSYFKKKKMLPTNWKYK